MSFHVGQKVVCVDDDQHGVIGERPPLTKGKIYTIRALNSCALCGSPSVDVGIATSHGKHACDCSRLYDPHGVWWCNASRFAPIIEDTEADEAVRKLLESVFETVPAIVERPS